MMAQKLRFSRGLKAKVPGAVTARVPAPTPLVKIFTGSAPIDWTQEATMVKVRIFFFYLRGVKCMIVILPTFWRSAPALKFSCWSWQLGRYVSLPTMLVHSYRRSLDEDGRSLWVGTSRSSFTAILRAVWLFFFHQAPPSAVSSPSQSSPHDSRHTHFQQDETSSLLDRRRHESRQTYRSYQLTLHLGTSTTLFPAIWTRTARSIEELFSQWTRPKRASSDQRTDEEDTSETCKNNHVGGRTMTNAKKQNWGRTYIYVLSHRDGRFGDVYIRPVAVNGLTGFYGDNKVLKGRAAQPDLNLWR